MIGISGIARVLEIWPRWKRPQPEPERRPGHRAAEPCPRCGQGHLRFDREIPAPGGARLYWRCSRPGCDFERCDAPAHHEPAGSPTQP